MIRAARTEVPKPEVLDKVFRDGKTELDRARDYYEALILAGDRIKTFDFSRYSHSDVKGALEEIFHGKCAYCEGAYSATQPVDVEHYRPKGPVAGVDGHHGYWWLAANWENLLPSCIDCNRQRRQVLPDFGPVTDWRLERLTEVAQFETGTTTLAGKASAFPLAVGAVHVNTPEDDVDAEARLLLDPTRDAPEDHLVFHVDTDRSLISLVYPMAAGATHSPQGAVSIQIYGLNRLGLVQARTRVLRDLEFLAHTSTELDILRLELLARLEGHKVVRAGMEEGPERLGLDGDIAMDTRVVGKLQELVNSLRAKIAEKARDESPYSAVAKAWVAAYMAQDVA